MINNEAANEIIKVCISSNGPHTDTDFEGKLKLPAKVIFEIFQEIKDEMPTWVDFQAFGYGTSGHIRLLPQFRTRASSFIEAGGFGDPIAKAKHLQ